jgi:hypothetical protein
VTSIVREPISFEKELASNANDDRTTGMIIRPSWEKARVSNQRAARSRKQHRIARQLDQVNKRLPPGICRRAWRTNYLFRNFCLRFGQLRTRCAVRQGIVVGAHFSSFRSTTNCRQQRIPHSSSVQYSPKRISRLAASDVDSMRPSCMSR